MSSLISSIANNELEKANQFLEEKMNQIVNKKLVEKKKMLSAEMYDSDTLPSVEKQKRGLAEDEETLEEQQRVAVVKARVRGGKIERRVKVSNVSGMTLRAGKLVRMTAAERRRRKLGAMKAKIKRRNKTAQILRKRQASLRKRQGLGL